MFSPLLAQMWPPRLIPELCSCGLELGVGWVSEDDMAAVGE